MERLSKSADGGKINKYNCFFKKKKTLIKECLLCSCFTKEYS